MNIWTDAWLREVANWKAVKEGKELRDTGAVVQVEVAGNTVRGAVRIGKAPRRLSVTIAGPHDITTKCGCPENRSTGAMCAHAVALLLQARDGETKKPEPAARDIISHKPVAAPAIAEVSIIAWSIELSPRWANELPQGRLTVILSHRTEEAGEPDAALSRWAAAMRIPSPAPNKPVPAQLRDQQITSFLEALDGHPSLRFGKSETAAFRCGVAPVIHARWLDGGTLELRREQGDEWTPWIDSKGILRGAVIRSAGGEGDASLLTIPEKLAQPIQKLITDGKITQPQSEWKRSLIEWQRTVSFADDSWLKEVRFEAAPVRFELLLDGTTERLHARLTAHYEGMPPRPVAPKIAQDDEAFLREAGEKHFLVRNEEAEREALAKLMRAGFTPDGDEELVARGEERVLFILADVLPKLGEAWTIREETKLRQTRAQIEIIRPQFREMGGGNDWLAFDVSFLGDSGMVLDRDQIQRLLKSGGNKAMLRGKRVILDSEFREVWAPLFAETEIRQEQGHWVARGEAIPLFEELRKNSHKELQVSAVGGADLPDFVGDLRSRLRDYQATGVGWLIERTQRWGCALLADDMGLGKTVQTIAWMRGLTGAPALVVAPTSLLGNWEQEVRKFAPEMKCVILHGTNRDRMREELATARVVITSYGTLVRDLALHLQQEYAGVILDEASMIRNPDTDASKAVAKLKSPARLALTGTPVENGVRDLWAIFRFLRPGYLGARDRFLDSYEKPLAEGSGGAVLQRLRVKISPFLLRRTKEEVAKDLPSKIVIDEWCELTREQQAVYRDLLKRGAELADEAKRRSGAPGMRMQVLTALLRLRQTCCDLGLFETADNASAKLSLDQRSSKLSRLRERLREAVESGHRVLVFSQFARQLRLIRIMLEEDGIESCLLDGATRDRTAEVARFQQPGGPPVFLISLKAGGYGLNLTEADVVVHFDPWWNPAAEAQATDRAHRIGQTRPVTVYRFLTRGTVEEKVRKLQERKRELLRSTFDDSQTSDPSNLSDSDLWQLLAD